MPKGNSINGKIVRELRRKLHMTQPTLAKKVGASTETIKRIEKAAIVDVGLELIPRLAEALGTTTETLENPATPEAAQIARDLVETLPKNQLAELVKLLAAAVSPQRPQKALAPSDPDAPMTAEIVDSVGHKRTVTEPEPPHGASGKRGRRDVSNSGGPK